MRSYSYPVAFCLLQFLTVLYYFIPLNQEEPSNRSKEPFRPPREEVIIFSATTFFGDRVDNRYMWTCSAEDKKYCRISNDPAEHSKAAAVIFHSRDFVLDPLPRKPEQVYVWYTQESPTNENIKVPENYINWTMTHWTESDIWSPYNKMEMLEKEIDVDWDGIWNNKTKTAAWVVSNCKAENKRLEIVKALVGQGLELDIFGGCGKPLPNCSRVAGPACAANQINKYKFYITMENSNCPDYISEKFWTSLTYFKAVPIVMKRSYYTNFGIPPSAFIALGDFKSLNEMKTYIENVSANRTLYMKHHNWRTEHRVHLGSATGLCDLCRRLKTNNFANKSYKDVASWFSKSTCDQKLYEKYL